MISFFGDYYGGVVVKNLKKVFYVICGVALVFVGIIIGGLFEIDADAQTESEVPEYKVVEVQVESHVERDRVEGEENSVQDETHIQMILNENYRNGYVFHEMVVTDYLGGERIVALECFLIFKKK